MQGEPLPPHLPCLPAHVLTYSRLACPCLVVGWRRGGVVVCEPAEGELRVSWLRVTTSSCAHGVARVARAMRWRRTAARLVAAALWCGRMAFGDVALRRGQPLQQEWWLRWEGGRPCVVGCRLVARDLSCLGLMNDN